jgi:nucleotide-binding universal stress UspA family protein
MALNEGPLVFPTDGTDASLVGLATVASFATAASWRLTLVHTLRGARPTGALVGALAQLPSHVERPDVIAVAGDQLASSMDGVSGGVLALLAARRRFANQLWVDTTQGRLLRDWRSPLLMVPAQYDARPIRRVLFPADLAPRSAAALDEAIALCGVFGAELHVLHVFGDDQRLPTEMDMARRAQTRSPRELLDIDRALIQGLAERAASRGVQASTRSLEGRAHTQILHYAAANQVDLVVMPTHGPRSIEDIVLGTTTARVVHGSGVPVIVLRSAPSRAGVSAA